MGRKVSLKFLAVLVCVVLLSLFYGREPEGDLIGFSQWPMWLQLSFQTAAPPTRTSTATTRQQPQTQPPQVVYNSTEVCETEMPDLKSLANGLTKTLLNLAGANQSQPLPPPRDRPRNGNCTVALTGRFAPDRRPQSYQAIQARYPDVRPGGAWRPSDCSPRSRIAVVVPYRDREEHLRVFLNVMHGFLQKQKLEYRIFVVEQTGKANFNRATLLNVGVYEALRTGADEFGLSELGQLADVFIGPHRPIPRPATTATPTKKTSVFNSTTPLSTTTPVLNFTTNSSLFDDVGRNASLTMEGASNFTATTSKTTRGNAPVSGIQQLADLYSRLRNTFECFAFHDVDLLPENDRMPYSCPTGGPRHLVTVSGKNSYRAIYDTYFGGASIVSLEQMLLSNGFSNMYFGWGGEDDDFGDRIKLIWKIARCSAGVGRYSALSHKNIRERDKNQKRVALWKAWQSRWQVDGLNSLQYCRLRVVSRVDEPLFTRILVHLDEWPTP